MRVTDDEINRAVEVLYDNLFTSSEVVISLRKSGVLDSIFSKLLLVPMDKDIHKTFAEILEDFLERRKNL